MILSELLMKLGILVLYVIILDFLYSLFCDHQLLGQPDKLSDNKVQVLMVNSLTIT